MPRTTPTSWRRGRPTDSTGRSLLPLAGGEIGRGLHDARHHLRHAVGLLRHTRCSFTGERALENDAELEEGKRLVVGQRAKVATGAFLVPASHLTAGRVAPGAAGLLAD